MAKKKEEEETPQEGGALELALVAIKKQFGNGAIFCTGEEPLVGINWVPSGSLSLDKGTGGGYPRGRIVEIYGPESCIAGESYLQYEVWTTSGKRINHKGGTIRRLYERFHNYITEEEPNQGRHLQKKKNIEFFVKAVDITGRVIHNQILDVISTGKKLCYKIKTDLGQQLISTLEHKYLTPTGYKALSELKVGDQVQIHNNTRVIGRKQYSSRPETYVKYHPYLSPKIIHDSKTEKDYLYYRGQTSRLVYESYLNKMSFTNYIDFLNEKTKSEICQLTFLPENIHVHHKDEDFTNNKIENLQLIDPSEHGKLHIKDRVRNLSFITVTATIIDITEECILDTYDLKCQYPYNNYIAEGIVVHNSGKTTLALHAIAEGQKDGLTCSFIDAEHALDLSYAQQLGVQVDKLLVSQPDCGEQALEIADLLARSGEVGIIVIDSVAALVPQVELEGDIGDQHMGLQARLMSQAMRKLTGSVHKSESLIIFINQTRQKIGIAYGNPEVTCGGLALKFYASQRLRISRAGEIKNGDVSIGINVKVKVTKNKVFPPFKEVEFRIIFGEGIDTYYDLIEFGIEHDFIKKSASWYSHGDTRIGQGIEPVVAYLKEHPSLCQEIRQKVLSGK